MQSEQCYSCLHYIGLDDKGVICDAFPNGIPRIIYEGKFDHTEPFEGDNGLRYENLEDSINKNIPR